VPRRGIAPASLVIVVALAIWIVGGVSAGQILLFIGYEIGFVAIPGGAVLWALRGRRSSLLETVALGGAVGSALEILAFSVTAAIGIRGLYLLYPVVAVAASALLIWKRGEPARPKPGAEPLSGRLMWAAALAMSVGVIYLALMFLPQTPLPSAQMAVAYSPDFVYQISKTAEVMLHWPPTNPGLSGVPLPYEWFVFFHMAAVSQVTHIGIPTIALRLNFIPTAVVIGCQLLLVGRALTGAAWTGVVAIVVVFLLGPLDLTNDTRAAPAFFSIFSNQLWGSWTFLFGLMFFLALLFLIAERLQPSPPRVATGVAYWVLVILLMIGASGAKATILPVVLVGTALYIAVSLVARRSVPRAALAMLALEFVVFVVTFFIIYRGGAADTGIEPLAPLDRTLPVIDASNAAIPLAIRAVLLPFAYVAALAGMILPLAGALYLLRRRHRDALRALSLCLCMLVAGVLIGNVFHQTGYSELYFQNTGYVAGAVAAAAGLRLAWLDAGGAVTISRRAVVLTFAAWVAVLVVIATVTALTLRNAPAEVTTYSVLGGGALLFIAICRLLGRRRGLTSGLLALLLIPLMAASALASPFELAPTVGRALTGSAITVSQPDPQKVRGLTPDLLAALTWLRDHSPADTVFAVSNHWIDPAEKDGRYYYYSAFSERQVFVEGYDANRYEINTSLSTNEGADFARRKGLNDAVFRSADANALSVLTQEYAVRFLFIDRVHADATPAVLKLGTVVFSNHDATIVAVG
jgi:hypothetical protein